VTIDESSQFASALKLCSRPGRWNVQVAGDDEEEAPYVAMTERLVDVFPASGGTFPIEPDASSGSYFWAADWVLRAGLDAAGSLIRVRHWPTTGWQIDQRFADSSELAVVISRKSDLGDSIMTAIAIAPLAPAPIRFTDLGRLRLQECERVAALRTELTKCGARVTESGDTLTVFPAAPGELRGAEIETYGDHRMAMCFAILGLKVPGIRLKNPSCVKKTVPNFFQKLAAATPDGMGVEIWEVQAGRRFRKLDGDGLFAE
jgi:3-phosphoshikimate 1-carboxyvinyltransferase